MIKDEIKKLLDTAIKKTGYKIPENLDVVVEVPKDPSHGDYSSNIAMVLAKTTKKNPMEVGQKIVSLMSSSTRKFQRNASRSGIQMDHGQARMTLLDSRLHGNDNLFKDIKIAKPGFINFWLSEEYLLSELAKILVEKDKYGSSNIGKGKTMVIDYSAPNIAKPMSVGHLRSTVIGQAIYNLYRFLGYKTIGDNHIGDWGTQFGKLIYAYKNWSKKKENLDIKDMLDLYIKFHKEAENDPDLEEKARAEFKKLEVGDKENRKIWQQFRKDSLIYFDKIYSMLGIKIDYTLGESFYEPMLAEIIKNALKSKVAKKSQGAIIIPLDDVGLPPFLIQKKDGATLYSTRDIATIKYRLKEFKPAKIIYVVGNEQSLHLKQLFTSVKKLKYQLPELVHVGFGLLRMTEGKMSTRAGRVIFLEDIINQAIEKSAQIIKEKNPELSKKEIEQVSKTIGIGAVKYNDLSQNRVSDIVFSYDKMLNLEGNSAPYLQYSYARAKSILRKAGTGKISGELSFTNNQEAKIVRELVKFSEAILNSAENYLPNHLANYLYNLATEFNSFYQLCPVLNSQPNEQKTRLAIVQAVTQVLKNGLGILGIEVVERM